MKRTITHRHSSRRLSHRARLLVLPHSYNDYRPHLIRWYGIAAILLTISALHFIPQLTGESAVLGKRTTSISENGLLAATNRERTSRGEAGLVINPKLTQAAHLKAADMIRYQYWAHVSPSGTQPWEWIDLAGYQYSRAGENLARGFRTSEGVVTAWMNSPSHQANVLGVEYSEVGFAATDAVFDGRSMTLVVALYGAPKRAVSDELGTVAAAGTATPNFMTRLGVGLQSMTPALLASILLLLIVAIVALIAHIERRNMPYVWRQRLMHHHGLIKAGGMFSLMILLLALYGGGQI